jgi:hypothetical protein
LLPVKNQVAHGHSEGLWEVHGNTAFYRAVAQWVEAFREDQDAAGYHQHDDSPQGFALEVIAGSEHVLDDMPVGCGGRDK